MTHERSEARRARTGKRRQFCVVHPGGHISDAELHEPILQHGDDIQAKQIGKNVAHLAGLSEIEINKPQV